MTNNNVTVNKELVNKLSNIIKGYDPYTAYIDDYKQYSNAVDINCELDQQFIHTCKEYGYDVEVSFCYSLAKSLASGKFDSAEETVIDYINSLTKEDDSILSSPNPILENNDNANKEETTMSKTKIRRDSHESFKSWINRINDLLSSNGIHLDNDKLLTIIDDETDCVSIESEDINVHGWCAGEPFYCCYDFHGNLKEYSDEGTNFESVEVEKEEDIMTNNANTTETNNSATIEKEKFTMKELVKRITENKKVHDKGYIDRPTLKTIMNEQFGFNFSNRSTRTEMVEALMNKYKDSLRVEDEVAYENEDNSVKEEITTEKTEDIPATHQVICIDHAYYDDEFVAFAGTQEECNDYINRHFTEEDARLGLFSYTIHPVPIDIPVGDLSITHDNAPEPIEESPATVVFDDGLALKILEGVIRQADTNKAHNFISDSMLTSIISELVLGCPLKDKGHEYYKSFTAEQRKILIDIRKAFINKASLITKTKNGKVTGYYIPAKILVWGRHIYLGVACVYRYISNNKILAEYHVSLNGIKNVATGNIAALDDAAYETLDTKCVFVM